MLARATRDRSEGAAEVERMTPLSEREVAATGFQRKDRQARKKARDLLSRLLDPDPMGDEIVQRRTNRRI